MQNRVYLCRRGYHEGQFKNRKKKRHLERAMYIRNQKLFSKITAQNEFKIKSRQFEIIKNCEIKVNWQTQKCSINIDV